MLADALPAGAEPVTFVEGDSIQASDGGQVVVQGQAALRRPGMVLHSERLQYDAATATVQIDQPFRLNAAGDRYTGSSAQVRTDALEGVVLQPTFHLLANGGHGGGSRLDLLDGQRASFADGTYTTCRPGGPGWVPDWIVRADRLDIDQEEQEGRVAYGVLEFKGMPLLPLRAMDFALGSQRRSGWLPPTIGLDNTSGLNLVLPYYWNIAPNRDATLYPLAMTRRGLDVGAEFRYLEDRYRGELYAHYMPDDRLRKRDRWGLFAQHSGQYHTGVDAIGTLGLNLELNRVSDGYHWRDFTQRSRMHLLRLLPSDANLNWARGPFSLHARALNWQTQQEASSVILPPYNVLPQITGRFARHQHGGFDYFAEISYSRFQRARHWATQPNAQRVHVWTQLARPFVQPWGFLVPKLQWQATTYRFDAPLPGGQRSANRSLPTFSLDGGLIFERSAQYFDRSFIQTLEPRIQYTYTPYRHQADLPVYDSGAYDFNFAAIWADNAFAGKDRVADNNVVTAGITTRLLDSRSGAETLRLGLAQRYRFSPQRVVLPGGMPTKRGWSDLLLGVGLSWDTRWAFDGVFQYNPDTGRTTRSTILARYSPGPQRSVSLDFRHQRDLDTRFLDLAWQWPLGGSPRQASGGGSCGGRWYSVGRLGHSLKERRLVEGMLGLEYDAGCWVGRIVVEKSKVSTNNANKRILFQLELLGVASVGSNPLSVLRKRVPGYQAVQPHFTETSRFSHYE